MVAQRVAPVGGAETHLAAAVAALEQAGHEVSLALGEDPATPDATTDFHVIRGLADNAPPAGAFARLSEVIGAVDPDLVHIQQLPAAGFVSVAAKAAPVVYNVHNHDLVCTSGEKYFRRPGQECGRPHGPGCIPNLIAHGCAHTRDPRGLPSRYRRTTRVLEDLKLAEVVIAHSRFVLDELRLNGIERAVTVPLFVDPLPAPSPPPTTGPVVFAGRVTRGKGVGTLLRAAALVDAPFEILGDGWWTPRAERLARRLGIESRVTFRGWLAAGDLEQAYRQARIVVVPSHWPEPFGLVGIEAMAVGRPVVASDTGGIPDWLSDGENGLLVEAGDAEGMGAALGALLADPDRAASLGARGAERVRRDFTVERYLDGLQAAYDLATRGRQN